MKHPICACARTQRARIIMSIALTCFVVFVVAMAAITIPGVGHSLDTNKEGPWLRNVYGRKAGSISSFKYSDALKGAQFTWDQNLQDKWLTNTESVISDNDMDFHIPKADERADLIEYLRVSSGR